MLGDRAWLGKLHGGLCALIAPVFAQARSRFTAFAYTGALLAVAGDRKSCWQLGEQAGHATPRRMQALLAEYAWDWRAVLARLQRFILAHLGDPEAILVLDETAELKKGEKCRHRHFSPYDEAAVMPHPCPVTAWCWSSRRAGAA